MLILLRALASALVVAGLASPAFAAHPSSPHGHPTTGPGYHSAMPPHGFHTAPPGFHGQLPHMTVRHAHPNFGPNHGLGLYHGRDFAHLSLVERNRWQGGTWRHAWHHGHYGWWWYVDNLWFFYPAPIYPYPAYIGSPDYYDYYDQYGTPDYYWYYCEDPPGYYPYVQHCNAPWQPVPPGPQ